MRRCLLLTVLAWVLAAQSVFAQRQDVGDRTIVAVGQVTNDRRTGVTRITAAVTNTSTGYIADLQLVVGNVPPGIPLTNASGTTEGGLPYVDLASALPPGASASVTLQFQNPARARIDFTPTVLGNPNTFLVFGPTEYQRATGPPTPVSADFSVGEETIPFRLVVESMGVSSAVVTLNGVETFGPSDFNANVGLLAKPVNLQLENELIVELRGKPGERLTIAVIGIGDVQPTIETLLVPAPNAAGWNNSVVTVTFQCASATSTIEFCSDPVVVSEETARLVVSGTARDALGNTAAASVTVKLDKTPPSIDGISPADGTIVTEPAVTVTGAVSDGLSGLAGIRCNGEAAILNGSTFSCNVILAPGANTVAIVATDVAGNDATVNLGLVLQTSPGDPIITGFNPTAAPVGTLISVTGAKLAPTSGPPLVTLNRRDGGSIEAPLAQFTAEGLSFVVPTGATTGPINIAVGEQGAVSNQPLEVTSSSDFTLTAAPGAVSLIQGQSASFAVTLSSENGFTQLAALNLGGTPAGVQSSFKPQSITAGQTSVLTLMAPADQALGPASLLISASATVDGIVLSSSAVIEVDVVSPTTSLVGRTVVDDPLQTPLAGVTVTMLGRDGNGGTTGCTGSTISDGAGNFTLLNLPPTCVGPQLVGYDGTTVTSPDGDYAGVNLIYTLASGQVTASPVLVHLPRIDNLETFSVQQNASEAQTHAFSSIPGLSVTVYKGTTFTMPDGSQPNPFPLVAANVPVDRLPDYKPPVPTMLLVFIVAFQPANARASQPVAVYYPNTIQTRPGVNMPLMTLDPTRGTMVPYGTGTVSPDGSQVIPDLDPAFPTHRYGIVNFDWHGQMPPPRPPNEDPPPEFCPIRPPKGMSCSTCPEGRTAKPVHYSSGIEAFTRTDISFGGGRGTIEISRLYRSLSNNTGPFGVGSNHNYGFSLDTLNPQTATLINLVTPEWMRIPFRRQGTTQTFTNDTAMLGSVLTVFSDGSASLRFKNGVTYHFIPPGQTFPLLQSITDANGNSILLTRNPNRLVQITEVTDPVGRSLSLTYDAQDRITSITDPIGRTVSYTYNALGALATVTDPEGGITRYDYSAANRLIRETDPRGVVVMENTYDANGRIIAQQQADGGVIQMQYTLLNPTASTSPVSQTVVTDPLGRQTVYRFNTQQALTETTDSVGQTRSYQRRPGSNLVAAITGNGGCPTCGNAAAGDVSFTYDDAGNVTTETDALGHKTQYTYEPLFNNIATITDPLGNVTRFVYDSGHNLISQTDANNHTTAYSYDQVGQLIETTDPLNQKTTFDYDGFGNLTSTTDALGNTTRFRYDAIGRRIETLDSLGRRTSTT